jgi:CRP-like cAMP-binding protein
VNSSTYNVDKSRPIKGQFIFLQGAEAKKLYLVKSGVVQLITKSDERIIPLYRATKNDILGEEALFSESVYNSSAVVIEDATIVEIERSDIEKVLNAGQEWIHKIMSLLANRLRDTEKILVEHKIISPELSGGHELSEEDISLMKPFL